MKNLIKILIIIFSIPAAFILISCTGTETPELTTLASSGISQTTASTGGLIINNEKTVIRSCGVCWSENRMPEITGSKTLDKAISGRFVSRITGLTPGTSYYIRAYATDTLGRTGYGSELIIKTPESVEVTDIDGNVYHAVTIDTQTWMTENLKTTRFRDGTRIPLVADSTEWSKLTSPGYCWYKNDEATYKGVYGALYNWYTVNTGKLCPAGWHIPGDPEWSALTNVLGGEKVAGGKLKKAGKTFWVTPNAGATNETGFSALPGGLRYYNGLYFDFGFSSYWWSSTGLTQDRAYFRFLHYLDSTAYRFENLKKIGFSIRCLQD